jgi:uncharacterized protein (DUF433 family)
MAAYVTKNDAGTLVVRDSRVSLTSIVHAFWRGETPEAIVQAFPSLSLEQVYGAIAWYLARRKRVDREIRQTDESWTGHRSAAAETNRRLRARLLSARTAT